MSESQIMREGWAEMVKAGGKLWRNNVGQGVVGKSRWVGRTAMVENASRVQYGLCVGSPDLVGHLSTVITQDMVGKRIAIAVYAEAKTPEGRIRPEQERFLETAKITEIESAHIAMIKQLIMGKNLKSCLSMDACQLPLMVARNFSEMVYCMIPTGYNEQ